MRLNQIQVIGTHNSYHRQPQPELLGALRAISPQVEQLAYNHLPLTKQLDEQKVRQIELDVYADPQGGLFYHRAGWALLGRDTASHEKVLLEPGFKVLHIPHIDFESTVLTLKKGLGEISRWSRENPGHIPIMVLIEVKQGLPSMVHKQVQSLGLPLPKAIELSDLDSLDQEIRSVFDDDQLITPDQVRGQRRTLEEAVLDDGWPRLDEARDKILFALDNLDEVRDLYLAGRPSLQERVMFVSTLPGQPSAAFIKINDPLAHADKIRDFVLAGYLVRTRADADLKEAFRGDTTRRDVALASGAQFISTDFPAPGHNGYAVTLPGYEEEEYRPNPVV